MKDILEKLLKLYDDGHMDAEYLPQEDIMQPSQEIHYIMEQLVRPMMPGSVDPVKAAQQMRDLSAADRSGLISQAGQKVVQPDFNFANNKSAQNLAIQYSKSEDPHQKERLMELMINLGRDLQ